ncbi:HlyD family efflux transporter periplasmic adaptor subunit [Phenylobacterium sp.]|jgi:membrane fusion protein (multidrug efflux system)|uniref:HlyD family secretion protein n=1 Tax=Phenylobacterium sp. TaxID=1871053 RepID=UPI002F953534
MNKPISQDELQGAASTASPSTKPARTASLRKKLFAGLAGAVVLVGGGAYAYQTGVAAKQVETDNAYVAADAAQVTALVGGPVAQVRVVDTQAVRKGDVLVVLDATNAHLDLAEAEAALAQTERKVRGYGANDQALGGQVAARKADVARAEAELARARLELDRRQALAGSGAVAGEELTSAKTAFSAAQAALAQARANVAAAEGSREANAVLISGVSLDANPEVAAARARVEQARVNLERTVIRAPVDGVVARRSVQVGQMLQTGAPLMSVVPVQQAYVNANFKEGQLRQVRIGQPVELESDLYGDKVVYHGKVVGLAGGTGSAFAVIPAQNATGNWIKVVQRLPVRVALDPKDLAAHPLKVGLSIKATIHIQD